MRNPARLAAALSGRPLLMREASIPALARQLGVSGEDRGTPLADLFGRARRALAMRGSETPRTEPEATAPRWVGDPDHIGFGWVLKDGVGILEIDGPLMAGGFGWDDCWYHGYDTLRVAYEEMAADARVGGIWEVVRSPGGVVDSGLPELAAFKRSIRALADGKPIHSFLRDGFSAAYWLPSASDRIDAARESGVGSIGAVVTWCGMSGMLENEGLEIRAFKFGARKTDGSPFEPLSDTAEATLQAEIDQCGRWFVEDVLAGRANLTEAAVLATEAGCFFGDSDDPALSGKAHGLVDEILTERASFAAIRELAQTRLSSGPTSAPATPAATATTQETDMKRSAVLAAAKKAGLSAEDQRKLSAELPEDDKPEDEDKPDEDDEAGDKPDDDAASETDDQDEEASTGAEAAKISSSAEAKTHPQLALAAIASSQTYAQFKASAGAVGQAPKKGPLASAMQGSRRVGSDAPRGQTGMASAVAARIEKNRSK